MMQKILVSAALIALGSSLAAQSTFTSPPGYGVKTSGGASNNLGLFYTAGDIGLGQVITNPVVHVTNPDMPTGKATLVQLEYRSVTDRLYHSYLGMARTIDNFALALGHAGKAVSQTFSTNWAGSPTTVYTATKLSLPGFTSGNPKQTWGNMGRFPFANSFMWDSTKGEMLMEFKSKGGQLANQGLKATFYLQDGVPNASCMSVQPAGASTAASRYLPRHPYIPFFSGGRCNDTALANGSDAYALFDFRLFSDRCPETNSPKGHYRIGSAVVNHTAPRKPVLAMLSLGGSDVGIPVSARCNRLHVNPQFPLQIMSGVAGTTGRTWFSGVPGGTSSKYHKWDNQWVGRSVYFQAAYDDTKGKMLSLTNATKLTLPSSVHRVDAPVRWALEYTDARSRRSAGAGRSFEGWYNPTERWTAK